MLTAAGREGILWMAGERYVSGRSAMVIVAIPPMVVEAWITMVAAEAAGGACGIQYVNCHFQLMGMIECVFGGYDGTWHVRRDVWN